VIVGGGGVQGASVLGVANGQFGGGGSQGRWLFAL